MYIIQLTAKEGRTFVGPGKYKDCEKWLLKNGFVQNAKHSSCWSGNKKSQVKMFESVSSVISLQAQIFNMYEFGNVSVQK